MATAALAVQGCATQTDVKRIVAEANAANIASVETLTGQPYFPVAGKAEGDKTAASIAGRQEDAEFRLRRMIASQPDPAISGPLQFRLAILHTVRKEPISARAAWNSVPLGTLDSRDRILYRSREPLVLWYQACDKPTALKAASDSIIGSPPIAPSESGFDSTYLGMLDAGVGDAIRDRNSGLAFYLSTIFADMTVQLFESDRHPQADARWVETFQRANSRMLQVHRMPETRNLQPGTPEAEYRRFHMDRVGRRLLGNKHRLGIDIGWTDSDKL
ncbi:hypothetical protein HAHE_13860 [Haloferula helveola]|uniref:Uncharacterized protein n=1 Tax=Haloferula helveola TaxID=490095 RepID=A0ABM7RKG1_9BACT|nr:hypothetical protein HAHE_13860 [Haloferula helveola]